ncbi:UPF0187 protein, chloroplastic [Auxenochlorella protothecoides]|uniref:UPF0187 protein, chloroplastic n=1 Tax=Auxenochlorella protothecoides TaxID=3075 RepID=A0A087SQM9_AUXPR|nr:UPF0187 protein, chloroplastic [Auxenochlorella protothecoides]KFM28033.1 UPF0187 protein, chloroplastic [Auxenochlorella protothecoides]
MPGALATSLDEPDRPQRSVSKTLKRAVSSYFVPRGRFKKLLESAENDNEADVYRRNSGHRVFTHADWAVHRKPSRYARHLALIFASRIFRSLIPPITAVTLISTLVGVYETLLKEHRLPAQWPHVTLALGQGFQLTAFALSLLLVFRTNSAYGRWWEARMLWGSLTNRTRDFVRQCLAFFPEDAKRLREAAVLWTIALPYVVKAHLREGNRLESELEGILTRDEVDALTGATHRPCFVLAALSQVVAAAGLDPQLRQRLDTNLTAFEDCIGGCERILRTPIPQSYTRHTSRFLMIWLIMMPFTLWAAYSWVSILLSGLFAYLMLGIDEIGVQIEEPFGVLPLGSFCATIERNLRELHYSNPEARFAALPWLVPASPTCSRASGSCDGADMAAGMDDIDPVAGKLPHLNGAPQAGQPRVYKHTSDAAELAAGHVRFAHRWLEPHPHLIHSPVHPHHPNHHHGHGHGHGAQEHGRGAFHQTSTLHADVEDQVVHPASYPTAARHTPPHRSWFGGRWVEED